MDGGEAAVNSVVNYVFGGFCLILIGLLVWLVKSVITGLGMWRKDRDKAEDRAFEMAMTTTKAIENNTAALVALKEQLIATTHEKNPN